MTEQELISGIKAGEEKAFKEFVDKYQELVVNVCNSFLHDRDDALDISQEVFIKVFHSADSFKGDSKISTWLYRIAVNKSLNFLRSKKRKNIFSSLDLLLEDKQNNPIDSVVDNGENAEEKMSKNEDIERMIAVIDQLPKKQKTAINLNKFEGLSYKEISEIMNISVTETGVLINRAKSKIQKQMISKIKKSKT
jgi:RNA polymerase sigma-70 factor (ECF subfamily)